MSLKKFPFTEATLCLQDVGAVEDTQVGISTAGHLPQTVKTSPKNLCVAAKTEYLKILLPHIMEGYRVSVVLILISTWVLLQLFIKEKYLEIDQNHFLPSLPTGDNVQGGKKDPCCSITALMLLAWILAGSWKCPYKPWPCSAVWLLGPGGEKECGWMTMKLIMQSELGVPTHFQRGRGEPARKQSEN